MALFEGKASRTYFNQLCSTYEGYTDENGEILKCNICLNEVEIGAEVCRLPCGHFNCKTCIEGWFDIRNDNSDDNDTSVEEDNGVSDKLFKSSTFLFNILLTPLRFLKNLLMYNDDHETPDKDEDAHSDEDSNTDSDSKASDEVPETSHFEEDPTPDVYWNEYVIVDDEEQRARTQCPYCKHICS